MIYSAVGIINKGAKWDDFFSESDDKQKYPNVTIEIGNKDEFIEVNDPLDKGEWMDFTVQEFTIEYIEKFLSDLIGEKIEIQECGTAISI